MSDIPPPPVPDAALQPDAPRVGVDEWVASAEERMERRSVLRRVVEAVPAPLRLAVFVAFAAVVPFFLSSGNLFIYGTYTLIYLMLGLGLNITVGYAGLLDLGYVAFFGFGAYGYAILSSDIHGIHWPAEASIPVVVIATAILGLLLGLPSWRLLGDYLAIVTLFFGQAFVVFVNNANPKGLTGGANGIGNIDNFDLFGLKITTDRGYYWFALGAFVVVIAALWSLLRSRIGRAWMALREDPLAAELMSIPVNRLKLLAFMFGAAIAGLVGTIQAAVLTGVASGNYDVSVLITIYAVVILGGAGSLTGVVLGAIVINVSYEILTPATPDRARELFYGVIVVALLAKLRPWPKLVAVLAGTAALGFVAHAVAGSHGAVTSGGFLTGAIKAWVVVPAHPGRLADYAYLALIVAVIVVTQLRGWWRTLALVPTLYLVALVWENLLVQQPAVTRLVLFGALLIGLMNIRPQGLLGTARVEIV
jgi:ABC-type branched-subunit amino acid transport system permease subunit